MICKALIVVRIRGLHVKNKKNVHAGNTVTNVFPACFLIMEKSL